MVSEKNIIFRFSGSLGQDLRITERDFYANESFPDRALHGL